MLALLLAVPAANSYAGWNDFTDKAKELGSKTAEASKGAWESTKEWTSDAWDSTKEWSSDAWDKSSDWIAEQDAKLDEMLEPETPEEERAARNTMSDVALAKLFKTQPNAKELFDKSYGYAVFDSRKFSLMIHTNSGSGVAANRKTGERIYMNMFGAGIAAGLGGKFYQQVMLYQTKADFDKFTAGGAENGWEASGEAGVVAWTESAELGHKFTNGVAVYVLNDKGLLIDANLTGSKYWRDGDLN